MRLDLTGFDSGKTALYRLMYTPSSAQSDRACYYYCLLMYKVLYLRVVDSIYQ